MAQLSLVIGWILTIFLGLLGVIILWLIIIGRIDLRKLISEPNGDASPDPLRNPSEAFGKLDEAKYKAELDLVDRYQAFVAELLRLSLAGIGVFGFLYQHIFSGFDVKQLAPGVVTKILWAKYLGATGVLILSLCAACALIFRFFATEGARYYIEALRFVAGEEGAPSEPNPYPLDRAKQSLATRYRKIIVCRYSKGFAAIFFGLGSVLIAGAFSLLVVST